MNISYKHIIVFIFMILFSIQNVHWFTPRFSNWMSLKYINKQWTLRDLNGKMQYINRNKTLSYNFHLEVLEKPIFGKYTLNNMTSKIINFLDKLWHKAENYNYLWVKNWDEIKYPFLMKQIYTIKNEEKYDIILQSSFFPLGEIFDYPIIEKWGNEAIYIGEDYWIKNPQVKIDDKIIDFYRKYKINTKHFNLPDWVSFKTRYTIQNEWNWELKIPAESVIEVEFSYYTTDINKRENWEKNINHYGYYHVGVERDYLEWLYVPFKHSLKIPKGYSILFQKSINYQIDSSGLYDNIPLTKWWYIEIIKDSKLIK